VVGKDGLLHSTADVWHYYFTVRDVYVVGHIYNDQGVSIATSYNAWKRDLTETEANNFLLTNQFPPPTDGKYWKRLPNQGSCAVWIFCNHAYRLMIDWRDIDQEKGLNRISLFAEQAYEAVRSRN
jgi:hypothetical protein